MSKIKKIIVSILIMIISIVLYSSTVSAKSKITIGNNESLKTLSLSSLEAAYNAYCIQHGAQLKRSSDVTYNIKYYVEIEGKTATSYKWNAGDKQYMDSKTGDIYAQMAYILNTNGGYGYYPNYSSTQLAVYDRWNSFASELGLPTYAANTSAGKITSSIQSGMDSYISQLNTTSSSGTTISAKDNTGTVGVDYSGSQYYVVGPFNWIFPSELDELNVEVEYFDGSKGTISSNDLIPSENYNNVAGSEDFHNTKIWAYSGDFNRTAETKYGVENITSGQNFYVLIDKTLGVKNITKVSGSGTTSSESSSNISARVWVLTKNAWQNVMVADTSSSSTGGPSNFSVETSNLTVNLGLTLKIVKVDGENSSKLLQGVEFTIKNSNDQYITNPSTGQNIFTTDANGQIKVTGLEEGTYYVQEVGLGDNTDYLLLEGPQKIELNTISGSNGIIILNVYNTVSRKFKIAKVDSDTNEPLQGVQFIIRYDDGSGNYQYVVQNSVGEITYTQQESEATKFTTDSKGIIEVEGLQKGNYQAKEVDLGNNTIYKMLDEWISLDVGKTGSTVDSTIIKNTRLYKFKIAKVDSDTNEPLQGVQFIIRYDAGNGSYQYVVQNSNGEITYTQQESEATKFITDSNGAIELEGLQSGSYQAKEVSLGNNTNYEMVEGWTSLEIGKIGNSVNSTTIKNTRLYKIKITKVDSISGKALSGVGFIIAKYDDDTQKEVYLKQVGNKIQYVTNRTEATEFVTDENGELLIENVTKGEYLFYETTNPNKGYEAEQNVVLDSVQTNTKDTVITKNIENVRKYIDISGYVWLDKVSSKKSIRNDLYDTSNSEYSDDNDALVKGAKVYLKDSNGNIVKNQDGKECTAVTDENGEYKFENVSVEGLENYYVEFEYDGLTYTNVTVGDLAGTATNTSKAKESDEARNALNSKFAKLENNVAIAEEGSTTSITYNRDTANYKSTTSYGDNTLSVNSSGKNMVEIKENEFTIKATTSETISLKEYYEKYFAESTDGEVKWVNLGIYEREQADLALVKDIQNAVLKVNGYTHTYSYGDRFKNAGEYGGTGFNVGVKFSNEYTSTYTRAIYKSDISYSAEDACDELKVYIIYRIALKNETSNLLERVNSIVDYYDTNYDLVAYGTTLDANGEVEKNASMSVEEKGTQNGYRKAIINLDGAKINPEGLQNVYIQFQVSKDKVVSLIEGKELLDNVAEINSYTTYDANGNLYAAIDTDSNPGNATPGDKTTYEDDTDEAPGMLLEYAGLRSVEGKVFIDSTTGDIQVGQVREGSGAYEDGEQGLAGVEVTLRQIKINEDGTYTIVPNGVTITTTTDNDGNFKLEDEEKFVAGEYIIEYVWGDETYTVRDYKSTIYKDKTGYVWFTQDVDNRLSDAYDDYETRKLIDAEVNDKLYSNKAESTNYADYQYNKMTSRTDSMMLGIESGDIKGDSNKSDYVVIEGYNIKNVDFGIVERARQALNTEKRVKSISIVLANGQEIINAEVENGSLKGQTQNVVYLPSSGSSYGRVKAELDSELVQGATVKVEYEIVVKNESELDYANENFYKYGIASGDTSNLITIRPSKVYDYLDSEMQMVEKQTTEFKTINYEQDVSEDWVTVFEEETHRSALTLNPDGSTIYKYETYYEIQQESTGTTWKEQVYTARTEAMKERNLLEAIVNIDLAPGQEWTTSLTASKVLSSSEDVNLDNMIEVVEIARDNGGRPLSISTNLSSNGSNSSSSGSEKLYAHAEEVVVTKPTGENKNYMSIVVVIVGALAVLTLGLVAIKKQFLK